MKKQENKNMQEKEIEIGWIDIISKMYKDLHNTEKVLHSSNNSTKKRDRLIKYFNRLEKLHQKVSESKNKSDELILKNLYYNLYIIKEDNIKENYFQIQKRIARERGYGNIEISEEEKNKIIKEIIDSQKKSLDKWIEFFLYDSEGKKLEMWEKYWIFQGIFSMGKYNKESGKFSKRDKYTICPFPEVKKEYISTTLKLMENYIKNKNGDLEIRQALGCGNFKQLYEYVISQYMLENKCNNKNNAGKWVKYEQGSDYKLLNLSLQGYYTDWCTAEETFAKGQLSTGDFYIYYSLDENDEAKVPRIAIKMNGKKEISEIRGIASGQNLECDMLAILDEKLNEFPEKEIYLKKEHDMNLLTLIERKINNDIELSVNELIFLYEIERKIDGFGYQKDPRITEILNKRDKKKDCAKIFNLSIDEISLTEEEWKNNNNKFKLLISDLDLSNLIVEEEIYLPQYIIGDIYLENLTSVEYIEMPQVIVGNVHLNNLEVVRNVTFPEKIVGNLNLGNIKFINGINLPKYIDGDLNLRGLLTAEKLILPKEVKGSINLRSLKTAYGLELPENLRSLDLRRLIDAVDLKLPKKLYGNLDLSSLTAIDNLELPLYIGETLYLRSLKSAKNLKLPKYIDGFLDLRQLVSIEELKLPYGFNLDKVLCSNLIKQEIEKDPNMYYQNIEFHESKKMSKDISRK